MRVFFATPSFSAPQDGYVRSLEDSLRLLSSCGHTAIVEMVGGDCYVQRARNTLAARFRETDATHLFFLDDDLDWPAEAVLKLIESALPITFGAYPMKTDAADYPVVLDVHPVTHQPMGRTDGWISAHHAPAGFLCITRNAIDRLVSGYPDLAYTEWQRGAAVKSTAHDLFPQGVRNGIWWGEDFAFCNLWRDLGGMIWCWPDITFGHTDRRTGKRYEGNYDRYLRSMPKKDEAA